MPKVTTTNPRPGVQIDTKPAADAAAAEAPQEYVHPQWAAPAQGGSYELVDGKLVLLSRTRHRDDPPDDAPVDAQAGPT